MHMPNIPAKYHTTLVAWAAGVGVSFILALLFVGVPKVGIVAWADEVDQKLQSALTPIHKELEQSTSLSKETAAETVAQSIFSATKEKCVALKAGRSVVFWTDRLIKLRERYKELTTKEFPPIDCKDL